METRREKALLELKLLNTYLKGDVVYERGILVLKIDDSIGEGRVFCVCLDAGLVALEFDIKLNKDSTICLDHQNRDLMHFLYCLQGSCFHKFKKETARTQVKELQSAVVSSDVNMLSELLIRKDERLVLNVMRIFRDKESENFGFDKNARDIHLKTLIDSFDGAKGYFHLGKLNLEIAELIKTLEGAKFANTVSSTMYFAGVCQIILAKQIEQFKKERVQGELPQTSLLKRELREMIELSDFVRNYPELQHSISTLCTRSGMSPSKLQQGFRFLHDMTIGEYVRDIRLRKAELLIRTTDMNISEVVYSIGLTSRSYFCKIFKNKYRCSPKKYKTGVFQPILD